MEAAPKRSGSLTFLLVGMVLLVTAAGIGSLLPLSACPQCTTARGILILGFQREIQENAARKAGTTLPDGPRCPYCLDRRKTTLLKKLTFELRGP